ncbi:hypothetical protein [Hymenobacter swuensis]|uniref:Uncharacterized protein n=1 Tax=Hymenobacter swuensis DY53 TaxID=1227739 RepID=W8F917_9BACT|nr:hypothetical protein [Hymenobacter swuensis]AHJ99141.1 hypothetical protein Hsw_3546 [Hymenobacter swuensis DY53]
MMRQLQWEELDLVQGLEVVPGEIGNGGQQFEVEQDGLCLLLTLWPEDSVVDVTLYQRKTRAVLLDFTVAVRGRIRYNNDQRGQYLEFPDCVLVSRISFSREQDEAAFNPNTFGRPLLVAVRPHLSVLFE